jgi:hypothetical protein
MKPFINIGEFGKKRLDYKSNIVLRKSMPITDIYSYIIGKGLEYLPTHETMDFVDITNRYSLFNLIVSAATMVWMIDIQKQEQKIYTESFSKNGENGSVGDRKIRYSVGSGTKFEIDGWVNGLQSKLIDALIGKYHSDIIVRRKWTENCAKIDILDIINTVFWTDFVRKIQNLHQSSNIFSLQIDVVYEEVNDYLLSAEERNNLINEALFWMIETFEKITVMPTS